MASKKANVAVDNQGIDLAASTQVLAQQPPTLDSAIDGAADETIRIPHGDVERIDGGPGIGTLVMDGKAMHIDLSALGLKVQGVEKFDPGAGGEAHMQVNGASSDVDPPGGHATGSGVTHDVYSNLAGTALMVEDKVHVTIL